MPADRTTPFFLAASAALQTAALLFAAGCDPSAAISGTVVDPSGAPIHDALVQLWYEGDPHRGVGVAHERRTDERGRFSVEEVGDPLEYSVIVEHAGVRRWFPLGPAPRGARSVRIRIGPTTPLLVRVMCAVPASGASPQIRIHWSPGNDLWYLGRIPPLDAAREPPIAELAPTSASATAPSRPPVSATDYAANIPLPEGVHRVEVTGPCGDFTRVVRVPPEARGLEPLLLGDAAR